MRRVVVARSAQELESLRPPWEQLQPGTLFQSFAWNRLAAAVFARREQPFVVYAESDGGAALIPAALSGASLVTFLGETLFDYRDVLCHGDGEALAMAWSKVAELNRTLAITSLYGAPGESWSGLAPQFYCYAPRVSRLQTTADEFAAAHARLGRLFRRLLREGAVLQRYPGDDSRLVRSVLERKAVQLAGTKNNLFADPLRIQFVVSAAALDPRACEIFTLEAGPELAAALITFRDGEVRRFYNVYFDQRWAQFSPGTVLCFEVTRRSLADGLDCDYMTGEQPHKLRLATDLAPLFRVHARAELVAEMAARHLVPQVAA